jgi:hypothetical protein
VDRDHWALPHPRTAYTVLGLLVLALPAVAYFWFIGHFSLDVIYYDSWSDIYLIGHPLTLTNQHNENRIVFPNIIVLGLADTTHFNVVIEEYVSGAMLVAASGLLIGAHRRRAPTTPWIAYVPLVLVMLSFVQAGSTLWGFQMAWFLVMVSLATTIYVLDRQTMTGPVMVVATTAAFIGSFSSVMGLFLWPVGLLLLWQRHRARGFFFGWCSAAVVTALLYLIGFSFNRTYSDPSFVFSHPVAGAKTFFFLLGDAFGLQSYDNQGLLPPGAPNVSTGVVILIGVVVCIVAVWVVVVYGLRREETSASPVGAALASFGLLYALNIAVGRTSTSPVGPSAGQSRYTTFSLLVVAGCYLAVVGRPTPDAEVRTRSRLTSYRLARWAVFASVALLLVSGTIEGVAYGRYWHGREVQMAAVTVNLHHVSDAVVDEVLYPNGSKWVRRWSHIAADRHLSLFANTTTRPR